MAGTGHSPTIVLRSLDSEGESPRGEGEGGVSVECEVTDILRRYSHVGGRAVSIKDFDLLKVCWGRVWEGGRWMGGSVYVLWRRRG